MESRIDRFYETIKPTTGEELKLISDILSEELTSAQFEVIKHFIFKGWCTYYAYTSAEFENLTTALDNIQEIPNLKNRINEIIKS